jgi:hypothetical protein
VNASQTAQTSPAFRPWRRLPFDGAASHPSHAGREAGCYRALVSWIVPLPLLLFAGTVALVPLAAVVRRPTSVPRLVAETFVVTLAVIAAVWAAELLLWLIEQRW